MLALCALALPMLALRVPAVPALAVRARAARFRAVCGVLLQRSSTPCGARRHCRQHTPDHPLVDPGDLTCPLPILSHIALLLLAHMHVPAMLHGGSRHRTCVLLVLLLG